MASGQKYGRFILISFLIGLAVGAVILFLIVPSIHNFLQKKKHDTITYPKQESIPQELDTKTEKKTEQTSKNIPRVVSVGEAPITELLSENAELLEQTDQIIANLEELFSDNETFPLEVIEKENYFNEAKRGQIAKEQLIAIWQYKLPQVNKNALKIDSLLLGSTLENEKDILIVEFWNSPLNYSGYHYQSKHLRLFGAPSKEDILFFYKDKKLSFIYGSDTIFIHETEDFIPINYTWE